MNMNSGSIVISIAGHDKNKIYVIVGRQDNKLLLADGKQKTLGVPKKKNRRHAQPVRDQKYSLETIFCQGDEVTDEMIKRAIKLYKKSSRIL